MRVGDVAGLRDALREVLAVERRPGEVRAFAERYGWREPIDDLVATFARAFEGAAA